MNLIQLQCDGFRCKRCDGKIIEADLAGDLVVDGEKYGCVKRFCYLGNTFDGTDLAVSEMDGCYSGRICIFDIQR